MKDDMLLKLSETLNLKNKLKLKKKQLEKLEYKLEAFTEFDKQYPHPNNKAEFILIQSKIVKCKSEILLLDSQIWEAEHPQSQPQ